MGKKQVSRRKFLRGSFAVAAGSSVAACSSAPTASGEVQRGEICGSAWERPPRQEGNKQNLILLVSDTFRADNLECYGSKWVECPHLNKFAEESIILQDAYPEGMPTIPIRRSLTTGRRIVPFYYYRQHEPVQLPGWHELYNEDVTLSETLSEAGYATALIADIPHMQRPGKNFHRGYRYYEWVRGQEVDYYASAPHDYPDFSDMFPQEYLNLPELSRELDRARYSPANSFRDFLRQYKVNRQRWEKECEALVELVARSSIRWLKDNHDQRPFFLHVEAFDPHEPWDPPRRFLEKYVPNPKGHTWPEPPYADVKVPEDGVKRLRANYAGESSCVDFWFGQILDTIRELGLLENSVVVFMSDHGALLGEQGQFVKGPERLRTQVTHIPLLIRMPNQEYSGKRVKGYVQIQDIMPTFLARLDLKPPSRSTGLDFWPLVTGDTKSIRESVVHAYGWIAAIRTPEWNLSTVWNPEKYQKTYSPQLYDTQKDPEELTSVADQHPDVVTDLTAKLKEYIA
ncbi:sulfatase-like hydrolase/transferase, partial [Acidobacteria bacterium AH-259-O06]|nr:sulfatase-like hydrolase/transferase [Acidobacteria bacterium AH-259-O06]